MGKAAKALILSIKAGAGHLRAAEAIEAAFRETRPQVEVRNVEALEFTNPAFRRSFTGIYNTLAVGLPSVWGIVYEGMEKKDNESKTKKLAALFDRMNSAPLLKMVREFAPDVVICTHYFPADVLAACRRKGTLRAKVYVVLTDYDIHAMWIQQGVDGYFVASEEMAYALEKRGVYGATVCATGIPVMPAFAGKYPAKSVMREALGLKEDFPTVLVTAGGFGMRDVNRTVADLADELGDVQLLAIAGRNEKLRDELETAAASRSGRIVPFGFVTNMHELMAASDLMVAKSGGLTSSECLAMGLPMVIYHPIPGQEERNADYLLEAGAAVRANSPAQLLFKAKKLLGDPERLASMRQAALRAAKPRAAYDIAEQVAG